MRCRCRRAVETDARAAVTGTRRGHRRFPNVFYRGLFRDDLHAPRLFGNVTLKSHWHFKYEGRNEYSSELRDYSVESQSTVTFTGEEIGDGYADVHSRMVIPEHPQLVPIDYLLKRENGTWKICDLEID